MTYRAIAGTETDPDAALLSMLMKALAANPIAIAEGAPGAPRIAHRALTSLYLGAGQGTGTGSSFVLTDLEDVSVMDCSLDFTVTSGHQIIIEASTNNGSSWGTAQYLINAGVSTISGNGRMMLNQRGAANALLTGTLTMPSGCNAIRIRPEHSSVSFSIMAWAAGGIID
jgi:hypothetical protein